MSKNPKMSRLTLHAKNSKHGDISKKKNTTTPVGDSYVNNPKKKPDPAGQRIFYNHMVAFNGNFNEDYDKNQSFKSKFSTKMHEFFNSKKKQSNHKDK